MRGPPAAKDSRGSDWARRGNGPGPSRPKRPLAHTSAGASGAGSARALRSRRSTLWRLGEHEHRRQDRQHAEQGHRQVHDRDEPEVLEHPHVANPSTAKPAIAVTPEASTAAPVDA